MWFRLSFKWGTDVLTHLITDNPVIVYWLRSIAIKGSAFYAMITCKAFFTLGYTGFFARVDIYFLIHRLQERHKYQNRAILLNLLLHGLMIFLYGYLQKRLLVAGNLLTGVIVPLMIRWNYCSLILKRCCPRIILEILFQIYRGIFNQKSSLSWGGFTRGSELIFCLYFLLAVHELLVKLQYFIRIMSSKKTFYFYWHL